jgi:glucose-1-phosphate thymidylyltransferase
LEDLASAGVRDVFIVVGPHNREQIASYVGDGSPFGLSVEYVVQERPLGIAHALSLVEGLVDGPFVLYLGDNLIEGGWGPICAASHRTRSCF